MLIPMLSSFLMPCLFLFLENSLMKLSLAWLTFWVFSHMYSMNLMKSGSMFLLLSYSLLTICILFFFSKKSLSFYILFEMSLLPTLLMVLLYGYQPEKLQASLYLLIYTVLSSLPLLLCLLSMPSYLSSLFIMPGVFSGVFLTLGFMVKTPMYMVHVWLPKAHVEAPVAGSMVLAGVLLKLGSYGLFIFCPLMHHYILLFYLMISILGSILGSYICTRQWDSKSLIAYSSVVHMGVVTIGVVSGSEMGYLCALMMVIAHGVCSPMMFAMAYLLYSNSHTRLLSSNRGLLTIPFMSLFLFLLLAINMGVPPFLNLWSEVLMFISLMTIFSNSLWMLIPIAFLGVLYNLFMYISLSHGKETFHLSFLGLMWPMISSITLSLLMSGNFSLFYVSSFIQSQFPMQLLCVDFLS
uniref:NADH-ubiquinone oxidoreductase chain 4 n=1 Tax=Parasagitta setosa TaxID=366441 RepID=A0A141CKM9_9BILA|nr:NADH dehydrogenase subunit 4 [Parasagitta setosa]